MVTTRCTSCGHEIAAGAQFCSQCGAPRPADVDPEATSVLSSPQVPPRAAAPAPGAPYGARTAGGFDLRRWLLSSLQPATILVFAAAAAAFGLPGFVYAYADYNSRGNGTRAVLALLLALALAAAVAGTWAASHLARDGRDDRTAARLVFGVGVFACVLAGLGFLAALGR